MKPALVISALVLSLALTWAWTEFSQEEEEERSYIADETESLFELLTLNALPERYRSEEYFDGKETRRVRAFSYKNCASQGIGMVESLSVTPDPLQFPGSINIDIKLAINNRTLDSLLPASLEISKKVAGIWIKLPCVDNFGSCKYEDLCQILQQIPDCPDKVVKSGLGCQCPFKPGSYQATDLSFEVDAAALPSGDYNITGSISYADKPAACLELILTVA